MFWRRGHEVSDEELSAYIDGAVSDAARARVEAHLASCARCSESIADLRSLRAALAMLPRSAAPRSFAVREADVQPAPRRQLVPAWASTALAGVATFAFLTFGALVGIDLSEGGDAGGGSDDSREAAAEPQAATDASGAAEEAAGEAADEAQSDGDLAPPQGLSDPTSNEPDKRTVDEFQDEAGEDAMYRAEGGTRAPASSELPPTAPPGDGDATTEAVSEDEDDGDLALRIAEGTTAAVALAATGTAGALWWRRRHA
jgi:anti-sigma factor RsiW